MLTVICVLKSGGGVYEEVYVKRLRNVVDKCLTVPHQFVCLTDIPEQIEFCQTVSLKHNWSGWWSKIELFRPGVFDCQSLYLDLDTLIIKDICELGNLAIELDFAMLRGLSKEAVKGDYPSSGVMLGNFSKQSTIYDKFVLEAEKFIDKGDREHKSRLWPGQGGDQGYIADVVGFDIDKIQDYLPSDYIKGKRFFNLNKALPLGTKVVAWSGVPRLHDEINNIRAYRWWSRVREESINV